MFGQDLRLKQLQRRLIASKAEVERIEAQIIDHNCRVKHSDKACEDCGAKAKSVRLIKNGDYDV